ncbi:hypothetical protein EPO44_15150, partial [bacterium]
MVFAYYKRLTRVQQRIYKQSDEVSSVRLSQEADFQLLLEKLAEALKREERRETEAICQRLVSSLTTSFKIRPVQVEVMEARPSRSWGELHGLYNPRRNQRAPKITVWMRTAQRHQVVAFRTFLRTLIHELCHHLDYELLRLAESFHTEGFYKRESSL